MSLRGAAGHRAPVPVKEGTAEQPKMDHDNAPVEEALIPAEQVRPKLGPRFPQEQRSQPSPETPMRKRRPPVSSSLLAAALALLTATPIGAQDPVPAVEAAVRSHWEAINRGDHAAVVAPALSGHDDLATWIEGLSEQFHLGARYTSSQVRVVGDRAVERYTGEMSLTPEAGGATVRETVKGIQVHRRQPDGSRLIEQDVWNSDAPAPVAAEAESD